MTRNMKFSHKILLAAALVVAVAFACFILFNDYRQRKPCSSTEASMQELGSLTTSNIQTWLKAASSCCNRWPSRSPPTAARPPA
jgi:methyl-accepting chemotaxis protein